MPDLPWPPSPSALRSPPAGERDARGPMATMRREHRELAAIMGAIADLIDSTPSGEPAALWRERLLAETASLGTRLEDHRDMEESLAFPLLLESEPAISPILDELGDDHLAIFDEWRRVSAAISWADQGAVPAFPPDALRSLRAFIEHLWGHTLGEEKLLDRVLGPVR